jgi:outer membrane protein OmpA-like peptidoglycan-associated protein
VAASAFKDKRVLKSESSNGRKNWLALQRRAVSQSEPAGVPPIVREVLRSPGRSLDVTTRSFMESRFTHDFTRVRLHTEPQVASLAIGPANDSYEQEANKVVDSIMQSVPLQRGLVEPRYDFSQVRVHDDARAAESARAVNALAYTVGKDMVFGEGQYAPEKTVGKKLLAHELTHTIQQSQGRSVAPQESNSLQISDPGNIHEIEAEKQALAVNEGETTAPTPVQYRLDVARLQRQADISQAPPELPCIPKSGPGHMPGTDIMFSISSTTLTASHKADIAAFVGEWVASGSMDDVMVDGWASVDGPQPLNWKLSCERAEAVKTELITRGVTAANVTTLAHGESTEFSTTDLTKNRRAIITKQPAGGNLLPPSTYTPPISIPPISIPPTGCEQPISMHKIKSGSFLGGLTMDSYYPKLKGKGVYNHPGTAGTFDTGTVVGAKIQLCGVIPSPCLPDLFQLEQTGFHKRYRINGKVHPEEGTTFDDIAESHNDASRPPFRQDFLNFGTPLGYIVSMGDPPGISYYVHGQYLDIEREIDFVTSLVGQSGRKSISWSIRQYVKGGSVIWNVLE